jgi:son of sevenless
MAALNSATIARLSQTWAVSLLTSLSLSYLMRMFQALPQKQKLQFEGLRKLADHSRNYSEYRSRLRNTTAPCVPFLGLYLTDITFCHEGIPSHRSPPSAPEQRLINFNKYHKLARIVQDMQRFQVPYTLKEIAEVQAYLKFQLDTSNRTSDLQDLYRRRCVRCNSSCFTFTNRYSSLFVEPRQPADIPPLSGEVRQLFGWAARNAPPQQQPPVPTAS